MSLAKFTVLVIVCGAFLFVPCAGVAHFGFGMRIIGDQLLLKDVLQSPPTATDENPSIGFKYAISEPITYIEILSDENILAEVNLSYENDLVIGKVTAIQINATATAATAMATLTSSSTTGTTDTTVSSTASPFEIVIVIYGFNETMLNVNPSLLLNRDQHFKGVLEPLRYGVSELSGDDDYEYVSESAEMLKSFDQIENVEGDDDDTDAEFDSDGVYGGDDIDNIHIPDDDDLDAEFEHKDKIIEMGRRQNGDYLIYETYQTSSIATENPTNHTVIFYYIDSNLITYVKFIIFDHFSAKVSTSPHYLPPLAEYSHFSPTTLKATIIDHNTTSLFVQMFLYGYGPERVPVDYVPFLTSMPHGIASSGESTESPPLAPMSPLQRLRQLMKAQEQNNKQEIQLEDINNETVEPTGLPVASGARGQRADSSAAFYTTSANVLLLAVSVWLVPYA